MQKNGVNLDDIDYILISAKEKNRYYSCGGYSKARLLKIFLLLLIVIIDVLGLILRLHTEKIILVFVILNLYLISNIDYLLHNKKILYRKKYPLVPIEANNHNLKKVYCSLIASTLKGDEIEATFEIDGVRQTYAIQSELTDKLASLKRYDKVTCFFYSYKKDTEEILLFCDIMSYDEYYRKHILIASSKRRLFSKRKKFIEPKKHQK